MCYINDIFISFAHFSYPYYSQFTGKIILEHRVICYIMLLYIAISFLFIICVCLMTGIVFHTGVDGQLTYL